jgi:predicted transcriptional regulator
MARQIRKTAVLTVRLAPEVKASLQAAADAERRSLANMLEVAVLEYCGNHGVNLALTRKGKEKATQR